MNAFLALLFALLTGGLTEVCQEDANASECAVDSGDATESEPIWKKRARRKQGEVNRISNGF